MLAWLLVSFAAAGIPGEGVPGEGVPGEEEAADEAAASGDAPVELPAPFRTDILLNVRREPTTKAGLRGRLAPGGAVEVLEVVEGPGCSAGWGRLADDAWACMAFLAPTDAAPAPVPSLVAFDPPEPDEYRPYRDEGTYDQAPVDDAEPLLPFIYGKRWRGWRGNVWASADAFAAGAAPVGQLDAGSKHAFLAAVDTPRGQVLVQDDGTVVPAAEVFLYPVSRFQGRDLAAVPVAEGRLPAWAVRYDGARLRGEPSPKAEVLATLPFQAPVEIDAAPASVDGRWRRIPDGLGPGVDAFVDGRTDLRWLAAADPPDGVAEDELWIDVDIDQQVLSVWQGDTVIYATLVSTGTSGKRGRYATPPGRYRIQDKAAWGDMTSLPGAADEYHVEKVPWVMHFKPRFALHGVFWHWGFGHVASHGCINMAPRDIAWLFDRVLPALPDGWHTTYVTRETPGTVLRVR